MELYQAEIAAKGAKILSQNKILFLSMEMRTGKTNTSYDVIDHCGFNKVLFVTKKKAITSILSDHLTTGRKFEIEVVNYESIHKVNGNFDCIVIDESHSIGSFPRPSARAKLLKNKCKDLPIIYLSGTLTPESYSQIYHQLWVSYYSPFLAFKNFYQWAKVYVDVKKKKINGFDINDYSKANISLIKTKIDHLIISLTQQEAGFESEIKEHIITCKMPDVIKYLSSELENKQYVRYLGKESVCDGAAAVIQKLSQVAGGTLFFEGDDKAMVVDTSKAEFIKERFAGQKIAIFYKYVAEGELLRYLFDWTDDSIVFANSNKTFVGQITAFREGVNLMCADALVIYNLDYSATTYFQVRNRHQHYNRKRDADVYYVFYEGCNISYKVMSALKKKKNFTLSYYNKAKTDSKAKAKKMVKQTVMNLFDVMREGIEI